MEFVMPSVLLVVGFVILVKGGDLMVDSASALAAKLSVSEIMIGLTVVAFGTSAPELIINVLSSIEGKNEIVFGNIIGSNLSNTLLILGVAGIIYPLSVEKNTVWKEIPFALMASVVFFILVNDALFNEASSNILSAGDGLILICFFIIFIIYTFGIPLVEVSETPEIHHMSMTKITTYLVIGFTGLFIGGKFVVDNAVKIAVMFNISEKLIGLTIISIGTSLPELMASIVAAFKKKSEIIIGNIVGSNIFNIFFILSTSALVRPLDFITVLNVDVILLIVASAALFITMFTGGKRTLDRWEAIILLLTYFGYLVFLLIRK